MRRFLIMLLAVAGWQPAGAGLADVEWDPNKDFGIFVVDGANPTLADSSGTGEGNIASLQSVSTGRHHVEFALTATRSGQGPGAMGWVGIADSAYANRTTGVSGTAYGYNGLGQLTTSDWNGNSISGSIELLVDPLLDVNLRDQATHVIMMALDLDADAVWFGLDGDWLGTVGDLGDAAVTGLAGPLYLQAHDTSVNVFYTLQVSGNGGVRLFDNPFVVPLPAAAPLILAGLAGLMLAGLMPGKVTGPIRHH